MLTAPDGVTVMVIEGVTVLELVWDAEDEADAVADEDDDVVGVMLGVAP